MIVHLVALMVSSASPANGTTATTEMTPPPKEKLVCTRNSVTGSRVRARRICQTKAERDADIEATREELEKLRMSNTRNSN